MSKIHIKKRGYSSSVVVKLGRGEELNAHEIEILMNQVYSEFLPVTVEKKSLTYNVSALVSLEEFLVKEISVDRFLLFMRNAVQIIKKVHTVYFFENNLLLDPKYMFIRPDTGQLVCIYIPVLHFKNVNNPKQFFLDFIKRLHIRSDESGIEITQVSKFLSNMVTFSYYELENFIIELNSPLEERKETAAHLNYPEGYSVSKEGSVIICPGCGTQNMSGARFCNCCGIEIGEKTAATEKIYVPVKQHAVEQVAAFETTVLGTDHFAETTVLCNEAGMQKNQACIVANTTKEKTYIQQDVFVIGKDERNVDFCISNNGAISRYHAQIIMSEHRYYIQDTNSTNGTFLNGAKLTPNVQYELYSGQEIKFANEEFLFQIEG